MREIEFRAWGAFEPYFDKEKIKFRMRHDILVREGRCFIVDTPYGGSMGAGTALIENTWPTGTN